MKTILKLSRVILFFAGAMTVRAQQFALPEPTAYSAVSRSAETTVWRRWVYQQGPSGQIISNAQSYVQCGSDLNYKNAAGQWEASSDAIAVLADGSGAATNCGIHAYWPADIYDGPIRLVTENGVELQSMPVCLAYATGTNTILLAALTNSVGTLVSSNEIVYPNAMAGPEVSADIDYVFHKSGLEQNLIIRSQLPPPEDFGLRSADPNLRVQLITEFLNCPSPVEGAGMTNPLDGLEDTTLAWGGLKMVQGRAFLIGGAKQKPRIFTYKSWLQVNGRQLLVEQAPFWRVQPDLAVLPAAPANAIVKVGAPAHRLSLSWNLPAPHPFRLGGGAHLLTRTALPGGDRQQKTGNGVRIASAGLSEKPGFDWDYLTVGSGATNWVFAADTTYFVGNGDNFYLYGTNVFEGSAIKFDGSGQITIDGNATIQCQTGPYLPCVFTSWNDNSIGISINGSSGTPNFQDVAGPFLELDATNTTLENIRFTYGEQGIEEGSAPNSLVLRDCQFLDVATPAHAYDIGLYNDLIGYSPDESAEVSNNAASEILVDDSLVAENVTSDSGYGFVNAENAGEIVALTNCLVTSQMITNGNGCTLETGAVVYLPAPPAPVYQSAGGGSYYLTNGSPYRGIGATNIDLDLMSDLAQRTTWPPIIYAQTNVSGLGSLGPSAARDNTGSPDVGWHYSPLDYAFGGCDLYTNLSVTAGTAVGWFYESDSAAGIRDAITLFNGANLSFNGNATQPCYFSRHSMVQEGGNGNWNDNNGGYLGAITFDGNNISGEPQLYCNFTKWTSDFAANPLRDDLAYGAGGFRNCEFYNAQISVYDMQNLDFTNCLFYRDFFAFWDQDYALSFAFENCTFYNGCLRYGRTSGLSGDSSSFWLIENCAFDGTGFKWQDNLDADSANTMINYNAYNTNNLSWQSYPFPYPPDYGTNEVVGPNDVMVTNFNWEASWFGNFYLPDNPGQQDGTLCIDAGSTTADQVGLYHFTTQTNQTPEYNSTVDIGYHYVATDPNGNPLDNNLDGIPDYLEDANGNGVVDSGEIDWQLSGDLGLKVIITQPRDGSTLP